ncbi:MAG: adenylate/guanylate cyclase [Chloroflexi bacterium CSP1-4]|nr:MAG: adenylate/guanylate cyclase [Chloroflexi bacterium CSP1-4]
MVRCPGCGEENPDRFRLCGFCGEPLIQALPAQEVRKTVTVVFSDLQGSTSLGEQLDSESLREVLNLYFRQMQAVLERHGGTVEKFIGDAIMAVFGLPRLHEDDALRAVRAAIEMQGALADVNERLEATYGVRLTNRTGVNTGEVVAGDVTAGQRLVTGDVVNTAARLEQAAPPNEILLGDSTFRLVRDAVEIERVEPLSLKGKADPVPAYRLLAVRGGEAVTRHLERPLVGRHKELAALDEALAAAVAERRPQLVTVLGSAGVGKSRLLEEFVRRSRDRATTLAGRCLNYGEGITFWPLAEIAKQAAGIVDEDAPHEAMAKLRAILPGDDGRVIDRLAAAIGLSDAALRVEEVFWGVGRFFEMLAVDRPLILLINDLHWAEKTLLELLTSVHETARAPIVVVASARHDLVEEHPDWGTAGPSSRILPVMPLDAEESGEVIANLLGTAAIDASVRDRIARSAEGNPLFVEQMLSMLIDDGSLRQHEGRWVASRELVDLDVPPSISALLSARLDRLPDDERSVIERASVVGQVFYPAAIVALADGSANGPPAPALAALERRQLVEPASTTFGDEPAYRFLHILIRDEAYAGILKRRRAGLHERFADWMLGAAGIRVAEQAEIIGYHLEQAVSYRRELGPLDEHGRTLATRASGQLALSGRRAYTRGDMPAAGNLLRRAAALLPPDDAARGRLLLLAGEAFSEEGAFADSEAILASAIEEAAARGDRVLETTAMLVRLHLHFATQGGDAAQVRAQTEEAIRTLEQAGDDEGLIRAWRLMTLIGWTVGQFAAAEYAASKTVEHARRTGDAVLEKRFVGLLATSTLFGPETVAHGIELSERLLDSAGDDSKSQGLVLAVLSHLHAMQGEFVLARDLYRRSRAILEEHGWMLYAATTSLDSGPVELLAGDAAAAERELRRDYEALQRMGERNYITTVAAYLSDAVYRQDRLDEADALTAFVEANAANDDYTPQFTWRCVRGKILARRGQMALGESLIREGLKIVRESDDIDSQADALMDLAEVVDRGGREDEAATYAREALAHYEAKGNLVFAAGARTWLHAREGSTAGTA